MSAVAHDSLPPLALPMYKLARQYRRQGRKARREREARTTAWTFRGAAERVVREHWSEVVIDGPTGTGKSLACLYKLHRTCERNAGVRALILRKTRVSLTTTGLVTFEDHVLGRDHPLLASGTPRKSRSTYSYPNGSIIEVGGLDKASRILSSDYDVIYVQQAEEITKDDWETLGTRLRHYAIPHQELIGDCNPSHPSHWIKARADTGETPLLHSLHRDNPKLHDGTDWTLEGKEYLERLERLTGVRRERFLLGLWAAAEGMVYGDVWNPAENLIDPFPIPREWRRFMSVDFGFTNPFVCGWWAMDGDGRLYLYRQIYMSGRTVRAHTDLINRINSGATEEEWATLEPSEKLRRVAYAGRVIESGNGNEPTYHPGERIEACVCDHDAEDRATMRENGISTKAAYKAVKYGIEKVSERMRPAKDGKPRLFIFRDSVVEVDESLRSAGLPWAAEQEVEGYVYPKGADGKPNKEEPVKVNDHGVDMVRYAACYVERGGGFRVEVF